MPHHFMEFALKSFYCLGLGFILTSSFALGQNAVSRSEKLVETNNLAGDKSDLLLNADFFKLTDKKVCFELGRFSERTYRFLSVVQQSSKKSESEVAPMSQFQADQIKLTTLVGELESFCDTHSDGNSFKEGDRQELHQHLLQIQELRQSLASLEAF